ARGSSAGSSPGASCSSSATRRRRPPRTASSSRTRVRRTSSVVARASVSSTSTPTDTARAGCSSSRDCGLAPLSTETVAAAAPPDPRLSARRRIAIVPAYNEERNVGRVVDELRAFDPGLEIVVVSDGSADRTAEVVSAIARQRVTDSTSGFQALNRKAIRLFAGDYPHDYPEVEGLVMVIRHRLRLREVPVSMRAREHGRSSIGALASVYYMAKV